MGSVSDWKRQTTPRLLSRTEYDAYMYYVPVDR